MAVFLDGICLIFGFSLVTSALADGKPTPIDLDDIVFVVLSQHNTYHLRRVQEFQQHIDNQLDNKQVKPVIYYTHSEWPEVGAWTILPILPDIVKRHTDKAWLFLCEEETRINLNSLLDHLNQYSSSKKQYLGMALRDKEATIIHHFAFHENPSVFSYPDFAAGTAFTFALLKKIIKKDVDANFAIDAKHELAKFIWDEGKGTNLTDVPFLCTGDANEKCATWYPTKFPECGDAIANEDLFVAVKTCEKFHKDRIPVVLKTWGKEAENIEYYSDVEDLSIPTVNLGIPNTERGHCGKTIAILEKFFTTVEMKEIPWLIIADDDTILSLPRLRKLLACYNPEEPVALGERYGYAVPKGYGYDYITGGGGMVFSKTAVYMLVDSHSCNCGSDDAPDDMTLGMCLKRLGIPITHSPLFHQARPSDYSDGYLSHQLPVSFHKHWMVDPYVVYKEWFQHTGHDEL